MSRGFQPSLLHIASISPSPSALVFLIPGNPGLISYYNTFLTSLAADLRALPDRKAPACHAAVFGTSLANFGPDPSAPIPFSLQGQVEFVERQLQGAAADVSSIGASPKRGGTSLDVVLVGHSVGAYIAMEVIRRWRERLETPGSEGNSAIRIVGFIGLWPTLTHLKQSKSGKRLGWLLLREGTARSAAFVASILAWVVPAFVLQFLVRLLTWQPQDAAGVTTNFIRQRHSVEQALYLARHELNEIGPDAWADDLWNGVYRPPRDDWRTSVRLHFGSNDHWVADEVRDDLIQTRASQEIQGSRSSVKMQVDQEEIPHSFCIRDSETVAKMTAGWVNEIVGEVR